MRLDWVTLMGTTDWCIFNGRGGYCERRIGFVKTNLANDPQCHFRRVFELQTEFLMKYSTISRHSNRLTNIHWIEFERLFVPIRKSVAFCMSQTTRHWSMVVILISGARRFRCRNKADHKPNPLIGLWFVECSRTLLADGDAELMMRFENRPNKRNKNETLGAILKPTLRKQCYLCWSPQPL